MAFTNISAIRDPDDINQVIVAWEYDNPEHSVMVRSDNPEIGDNYTESPFIYPLNRWLSDTVWLIALDENDSAIETSDPMVVNAYPAELTAPQNVIATRTEYHHLQFAFDTPAWFADMPSF